MCESLGVLPDDLIVAGSECFLFLVGEALDPVLQDLCTIREDRQLRTDKGIRVHPHLFGWGNDNPHSSFFISKPSIIPKCHIPQ